MKPPFSVVLCPTDFSEAGDAAVRTAYALAAPGGVVHLLHFPEPQLTASLPTPLPGGPLPTAAPQAVAKFGERLRRLVPASAAAQGIRTETHVIDGPDDPVTLIEREGKRLGAQVVLLGSHGKKGWREILLGSVAAGSLKRLTLPLVLVRPQK